MINLLAEALDGSEDFVGRFGPAEGLWVGVMLIDEAADIGFELADGSMDVALDRLAGEFYEATFDVVDP